MRDAPAYYNEFDPAAAAWLRELIVAGLIPHGDVDERSIEDVKPGDLSGYRQCHFFAGIGGWAYALALAGWPPDRPVWTGSCPCQPFSAAGKGTGFDDQRHLWPAWFHLIRECRPAAVFGEQVASKAADQWIDLVHADVEGVGYAFGCVPFPAAGVSALHIRDRAYWVAYSNRERSNWLNSHVLVGRQGETGAEAERRMPWSDLERIECPDGRTRLCKPGLELLADGLPHELGMLAGFGNAIVPQAAAEFVIAAELARADMLDRALRAAA